MVVTNQACVGRGIVPMPRMLELHEQALGELRTAGAHVHAQRDLSARARRGVRLSQTSCRDAPRRADPTGGATSRLRRSLRLNNRAVHDCVTGATAPPPTTSDARASSIGRRISPLNSRSTFLTVIVFRKIDVDRVEVPAMQPEAAEAVAFFESEIVAAEEAITAVTTGLGDVAELRGRNRHLHGRRQRSTHRQSRSRRSPCRRPKPAATVPPTQTGRHAHRRPQQAGFRTADTCREAARAGGGHQC